MKALYLDCNMGAAGDMLMSALLELHPNPTDFLSHFNSCGIPGVLVTTGPTVKCGITGRQINVKINGLEENYSTEHCEFKYEHTNHHQHRLNNLHHIKHLIDKLNISDTAKANALEVYKLIASAESYVHGMPVNLIHFHEVGNLDAIADIVGVCMLIEELSPDTILASPVNVGSGTVHCAHGTLPVPAPATAYILKNVPIYSEQTAGELCTPTGAALLKFFVNQFCDMPVISASKIGYGMGKKDYKKANCIRAYTGNVIWDNQKSGKVNIKSF